MQIMTIHRNDEFRVDSWGNGWGYAVQFGSADNLPMRTIWFQDEDATILSDDFDARENAEPNKATSEIWLETLDPYL